MPTLTDEECFAYARRQLARQLTEADAERCKTFDDADLARIASHLPLQTEPFTLVTGLGIFLVRNSAHQKLQAARAMADDLRKLVHDIESKSGYFTPLRPEQGIDRGIKSQAHRVGAMAWPVADALVDDFWRPRAVEALNGLIAAILAQKFSDADAAEVIGKVGTGPRGMVVQEWAHEGN